MVEARDYPFVDSHRVVCQIGMTIYLAKPRTNTAFDYTAAITATITVVC